MTRSYQRSERDERGAFMVLWAVLVVALLVMLAIVVDLGQVRSDRRANQSLADYAALAAGLKLSGRNLPVPARDPQGACQGALESLKRNGPNLPSSTSIPCSTLPAVCVNPSSSPPTAGTAPVTIQSTGSGDYRIEIEYPVAPSRIADSRFSGAVGANDGLPCSRMRVSVLRRSPSFFAGIVGGANWEPVASAVVRGEVDESTLQVAALLLLERNGCAALQSSGQGAVIVLSPSASNPGRIHADSRGSTAGGLCTTNNNPGGFVVYGSQLPSASGSGPSIVAQNSSDGTLGVIGVYAMNPSENPARAGAVYPSGINVAPTPGGIMSRRIVDNKYNNPSSGSGAAVTALHNSATARAAWTPAQAAAAGYTVLPGPAEPAFSCNGGPLTVSLANVFVNCTDYQASDASVFTGTDFVFAGKVSVANNKLLSLPNARSIVVRGCVGCDGGGNYSASVAGTLRINQGVATTCAGRLGPGAGGTTTSWASLALMDGPFEITGSVQMCQTFVYIAGGVAPNQSTSSNTGQNVNCSSALPCPISNAGDGAISMSGGGSSADWTAPNQLSGEPDSTSPFEDIALWTETAADTALKATGSNRTEGVYFLPNSLMTFTGQATQDQPLNAQFISRRLDMKGQGDLALRPNPADAIKIPVPGLIALIR